MHRRARLAPSVVVGLAVLASATTVGADDAIDARIEANETTAVAALEAIRAAQERFKAARVVDVNQDGVGEFGLLRELSGDIPVRTNADGTGVGTALDPPVLPVQFSVFNAHGDVSRSGYLFHMILPGAQGTGVVEVATGALNAPVDSDAAATTWCCYAWPEAYGESGRRSFFVNQTGTIVATDVRAYSGDGALGTAALVGVAMRAGGLLTRITEEVAVDTTGRDGNYWRLVTPQPRPQRTPGHAPLFQDLYLLRRIGTVRATIDRRPTVSREALTVRAGRLQPHARYEVLLEALPMRVPVSFGTVRTSSTGNLRFRFDSTRDAFPDGIATLTRFDGGSLRLRFAGPGPADDRPFAELRIPDVASAAPSSGDRIADEEAAAVTALREIEAAQQAFVAAHVVDVDGDGRGEYGLLRELTGREPPRVTFDATPGFQPLDRAYLPAFFRPLYPNSEALHSGYLFHMLLPGAGGRGVVEVATGSLAAILDSDLAETTWCCYAWPRRSGVTGEHAFFINQLGTVTATRSPWYSGSETLGTAWNGGAALVLGDFLTAITGPLANGVEGRDGNRWHAVPDRPLDVRWIVSGALRATDDGATASGTFSITTLHLRFGNYRRVHTEASGLVPDARYAVYGVETSVGFFGAPVFRVDASGRAVIDCPGCGFYELSDDDATPIGGGILGVRRLDSHALVLRGAIPRAATETGPNEPGASLVHRGAAVLYPGPGLRLKRGDLEALIVSDAAGTHEELTLSITTFDRLADRADVVAVADGAETPLGTIRLSGDRGAGTLQLDTSRGDAVPGGSLRTLAGARIEVRDRTSAVLLTGTFPAVQ